LPKFSEILRRPRGEAEVNKLFTNYIMCKDLVKVHITAATPNIPKTV